MNVGTCKHFNGYDKGTCRNGVNYRQLVGGPAFGWAARLPCIKDSPLNKEPQAVCEKFAEPTAEEVAASRKELDDHQKNVLAAIKSIRDLKPAKGTSGSVSCPKCKGTLRFSVAASNGHIWGQCQSEGCLAWMM